jgi:hypothetical protein
MTNPADHFFLTPDASRVIDKRTGTSWTTHEVARILFGKEKEPTMPRYRHPLLARDQNYTNTMPVRGGITNYDQDPGETNGGQTLSAAECVQFVKICAAKLQGPDREEFLSGIADLLGTEEGAMDRIVATNAGALDRSRSGNPAGRDNRRPGAMDANIQELNSRSFQRRFPFVNVSLNGAGR